MAVSTCVCCGDEELGLPPAAARSAFEPCNDCGAPCCVSCICECCSVGGCCIEGEQCIGCGQIACDDFMTAAHGEDFHTTCIRCKLTCARCTMPACASCAKQCALCAAVMHTHHGWRWVVDTGPRFRNFFYCDADVAAVRRWRPRTHARFPASVRRALRTLLILATAHRSEIRRAVRNRPRCQDDCYAGAQLCRLPVELRDYLFEFFSMAVPTSCVH